jgi:hypothetical protein
MVRFTNGVDTYDVTDPAHIDCFRAKGWKMVDVPDKTKSEVKTPAKTAKASKKAD